jgi:hypothetical protein
MKNTPILACAKTAFVGWPSTESSWITSFHNFLSYIHYIRKCYKLVYRKNVVMVTLTISIMFLLFTCMHFRLWRILWRWSVCSKHLWAMHDCWKFEEHWFKICLWIINLKLQRQVEHKLGKNNGFRDIWSITERKKVTSRRNQGKRVNGPRAYSSSVWDWKRSDSRKLHHMLAGDRVSRYWESHTCWNEPDIPNILIRGEGREVFLSLSAFHGNLTLASCAKEKYQGCLFFHLSAIRNHAWVKAK